MLIINISIIRNASIIRNVLVCAAYSHSRHLQTEGNLLMKVKIVRSNRKTIAIQIAQDLSVTVRAPYYVSREEIDRVLQKKESWILENIEEIKKNHVGEPEELTRAQIDELGDRALRYIPNRVIHYAVEMHVRFGKVTIRNQKTRWGSCSSNGNLNFNCQLMRMPPEVIDYVVVHELCHLKEMNHSKAFWEEVEKVMPDYRIHREYLKKQRILPTSEKPLFPF